MRYFLLYLLMPFWIVVFYWSIVLLFVVFYGLFYLFCALWPLFVLLILALAVWALMKQHSVAMVATVGVAIGVAAWLCRTRLGRVVLLGLMLIAGACWIHQSWMNEHPKAFAPNAPVVPVEQVAAPSPPAPLATPPPVQAQLGFAPRAELVKLPVRRAQPVRLTHKHS
jgi:hypothetical protein